MADVLDVISLPETKVAINMDATNTTHDAELATHITAVSRIMDRMFGPVVVRTVTAEFHAGGCEDIYLERHPVTSVTTVREVRTAGAITVVAAIGFGSAGDGYFPAKWRLDPALLSGRLSRRLGGVPYYWPTGDQTVEVTYQAGRYATTATVDDRFVTAAGAVMRRLWKRESGIWSQSATVFEDASLDDEANSGFFRVVKPILTELLNDELVVTPGFA